MGVPVFIRLDDDVREELATLIRDLATESAREARRTRIREASAAIGVHVAQSSEGDAFYRGWGTPRADVG